MIQADELRVRELALSCANLRTAPDFAEQITPTIDAPRETALRAFFWASAICHSTQNGLLGEFEGRPYKGWDYLLRAFCNAAESNPESVAPSQIERLTSNQLAALLAAHAQRSKVHLSDLPRRAAMLRATARELIAAYGGAVGVLLDECNNLVGGVTGAYTRLSAFESFADPLRKKSSAFLMTVYFSRLWIIFDHHNVVPMIDYHRMRLLLRTGCIVLTDPAERQLLRNQEPAPDSLEDELRRVAAQVCIMAQSITGMPMFEFDVLLWAHARSCCRYQPICTGTLPENDSFYRYVSQEYHGRCEFQSWCLGAENDESRQLWEPNVETERY